MTSLAFIIGMLILGICTIGAAFILSGAITGAAATAKESAPQSLQQPMLSFFTEFDAADYLGISLNELDYMRGEGMLDDTFVAVTSMEQTGEEEYYAMEDGLEVIKLRPTMAPVTRFLFNRQLLDERMLQLIKEGKHVNPTRAKSAGTKSNKPNKGNGQKKNNENRSSENRNNENRSKENRNSEQKKNSENKSERRENDSTKIYNNNNKKNGERDNNGKHNNEKRAERSDNENTKPSKRPSYADDDDDFFSKGAKGEHGRNNSGKPGISYEDDSSDTKVVDIVSSSYFDD